jgi:hypothetical protein
MIALVVSLLVIAVVAVVGYFLIRKYDTPVQSDQPLQTNAVSTIQDGRKGSTFAGTLPRSFNQSGGIGFSYAGWIRIDDFTYRQGIQKVIFVKGQPDASTACPALVLDGNSNSLLVKIDTYGQQDTLSIQNIPAKKWIHIVLTVDQDSANVYINGTLARSHTMSQLPKQNDSTLAIAPNGGFDGKIGLLTYYNYTLGPTDVQALVATPPTPDASDAGIGPVPPYLDGSWWTGRS